MADFENAHRTASPRERDGCHAEVVALQGLDKHLRERSEALLEMVAEEFREQLGLPAGGVHTVGRDPLQAVLDRKA